MLTLLIQEYCFTVKNKVYSLKHKNMKLNCDNIFCKFLYVYLVFCYAVDCKNIIYIKLIIEISQFREKNFELTQKLVNFNLFLAKQEDRLASFNDKLANLI